MHPRRYGVPILGLLLLTVCVQGRVSAAAIDVLGIFEDYLKIVLRVREDFARAIATFEQFLGRADVTPDLRERLLSWVEALKELQPQGLTGEALARARALIEAGQRRNRFPADQLGLVHFVVAALLVEPEGGV